MLWGTKEWGEERLMEEEYWKEPGYSESLNMEISIWSYASIRDGGHSSTR